MIDAILKETGLPYKQARFISPPAGTYAIYFDDVGRPDGPDPVPGLDLTQVHLPVPHDVSVELYAPAPDPVAEKAIETAILRRGLTFEKDDRIWLREEQRYQTVYRLSYIKKE